MPEKKNLMTNFLIKKKKTFVRINRLRQHRNSFEAILWSLQNGRANVNASPPCADPRTVRELPKPILAMGPV